jgi:hypothetical protein
MLKDHVSHRVEHAIASGDPVRREQYDREALSQPIRKQHDAKRGEWLPKFMTFEVLLQALTIDAERVLPLHAVGISGNSMPVDRIMSRCQRRWQGHDELFLILWIGRRNAGRDCLPTFIFDFHTRKFCDYAFAKIQLDLGGGDLARNISCGANRYQFRMSIG